MDHNLGRTISFTLSSCHLGRRKAPWNCEVPEWLSLSLNETMSTTYAFTKMAWLTRCFEHAYPIVCSYQCTLINATLHAIYFTSRRFSRFMLLDWSKDKLQHLSSNNRSKDLIHCLYLNQALTCVPCRHMGMPTPRIIVKEGRVFGFVTHYNCMCPKLDPDHLYGDLSIGFFNRVKCRKWS